MKFAVCVISLGYTRLAGITLYDSQSRDFTETTPRVARELMKKGLVKGVLWDEKENMFVPDPEFGMTDILVKTGVGKYRPLLNDVPGMPIYSSYTLVRVLETNKGRLFELISNKCQRVKISEEALIGLSKIGNIGGVIITENEDNTTSIKICDGVVIENRVYPDEAKVGVDLPLNIDGAYTDQPEEGVTGTDGSETDYTEDDTVDEPDGQAEEEGNTESNKPESLEEVFKNLGNVEGTEEETEGTAEKKAAASKKKDRKSKR